jgi:hypothetical protein
MIAGSEKRKTAKTKPSNIAGILGGESVDSDGLLGLTNTGTILPRE